MCVLAITTCGARLKLLDFVAGRGSLLDRGADRQHIGGPRPGAIRDFDFGPTED